MPHFLIHLLFVVLLFSAHQETDRGTERGADFGTYFGADGGADLQTKKEPHSLSNKESYT